MKSILNFCLCINGNKKEWTLYYHSVMSDSATPWTVAYQAPPSMGFSRQEYWSGLHNFMPGSKIFF